MMYSEEYWDDIALNTFRNLDTDFRNLDIGNRSGKS